MAGERITGSDSRTGARAAYSACAWSLSFAALHLSWGIGRWELPASVTVGRDQVRSTSFILTGMWGVGVVCLGAAVLALALVCWWGTTFPSWVPWFGGSPVPPWMVLVPAWAATAVLLVHWAYDSVMMALAWGGAITLDTPAVQERGIGVIAPLYIFAFEPCFLLGGVLFGIAARHYGRRRREQARSAAGDAVLAS